MAIRFNGLMPKNIMNNGYKINNKDNNIILDNPKEKYNELYSDFDIKNLSFDFLERIDKKMIIPSNILSYLYHKLGYKNYQIINNDEITINQSYIGNNITEFYNKNDLNKTISFSLNKNKDKILYLKKYNYYNNIYDRLYNYGFYIKNKKIIKKINSEQELSNIKFNQKRNIFLNNKYNRIRFNKNNNYLEEETFKPIIDKNSIKISNRLKKRKNKLNKEGKSFSFSFNNKYNNISDEYFNLINYKKNLNDSNNVKINKKSIFQRLFIPYKKDKKKEKNAKLKKENNSIGNHKCLNNINDLKKIIKNKKININLNNNKKKDKFISSLNVKKRTELYKEKENKNVSLKIPVKTNFQKTKKFKFNHTPKIKINTYVSLNKKKESHFYNNDNNINEKKNIIISNKKRSLCDDKTKKNNTCKNLKVFINNEGKKIFISKQNKQDINVKLDYFNKIFLRKNIIDKKNKFFDLVKEINISINK